MWLNAPSYKRITDFDRLQLLLWKNSLLITRTRSKLFTLIFVPLLFISVFVAIKLLLPDEEADHQSYTGIPITRPPSQYTNSSHLVFVANNFKEATILMKEIEILLDLNSSSFEVFSGAEMEDYLKQRGPNAIGGIEFDQRSSLIATIRVSGLRTKLSSAEHWWYTDLLYPWLVETEPRYSTDSDGGLVPGYVRTGFVAIQSALSKAYLKLHVKTKERIPEIHLKRFPHPPFLRKSSLYINKIVLNVFSVIGVYFICLYNVKVSEI